MKVPRRSQNARKSGVFWGKIVGKARLWERQVRAEVLNSCAGCSLMPRCAAQSWGEKTKKTDGSFEPSVRRIT
jgi:hypothetical protein